MNSLLGKKRDSDKGNSDNRDSHKKVEESEAKNEINLKEEKKSLFGNFPSGGLLFPAQSDDKEKKPLFGSFDFSKDTKGSSLFGNGSLFSNPELTKTSSLFSQIQSNSNLFSEKRESDESDGEEEEYIKKESEKIKGFDPFQENPKSEYNSIYVKSIDALHIFNSKENKFQSKGKGFISIEKHKEKNFAVVLFRNAMGTKLLEGVFNEKSKQCEILDKGGRFVASFAAIEIIDDKPNVRVCRIPVNF